MSLAEWNLENFGLVDNIQYNGYEVFITGENDILRIYGVEDDYAETSIHLGYVEEALEREPLQHIEMNTYLEDIDVSTLNATVKFKDGSSVYFAFNQIEENDDYSFDNLTIQAKYMAN